MAQVVGQIPTNSQARAPTTDESGYIDEGYLDNLRRLGTRPSVQQFNGNNNATRVINSQQGQEEAEDTLSDMSDFDEEWEEIVQQMQQILVAFLLPLLGRWLGRKFSFWAWSRFVEWYYYPRITYKAKIETTETTISSP
ncbi:hypothetical protein RclHR1_14860007 [Rhizophagus clarus]|uniref:Uncharacterized protein n=1 Tax=Rhizophagus clarus TaxID=94130 RepID=A0A2Z6QFI6_9GLOM|nr:hypothetical protein RclHR1_14860007 [Rhizophagus clarus]GES93785.1 hypothetical protein GLOIN_2v1676516 [Rhizophagus clarus]